VQWIALELDEAAHYENRPGVAVKSNWAARCFTHSSIRSKPFPGKNCEYTVRTIAIT
jgi:hypothetical protein